MREDTNMEKNAESIVQAHLRGSISQKTFVAILVTALLLSAPAIFVGYRVYADNMDQHYTTTPSGWPGRPRGCWIPGRWTDAPVRSEPSTIP